MLFLVTTGLLRQKAVPVNITSGVWRRLGGRATERAPLPVRPLLPRLFRGREPLHKKSRDFSPVWK